MIDDARQTGWPFGALWAAAAALLLAAAAPAAQGELPPQPGPATQPAKVVPVEKPHWRDDGCAKCHDVKDGQTPAAAPADAESLCLGCHDGKRAKAELHPVGVAPTNARIAEPAKWPMRDGRLSCLTCHDPRLACSRPAFRPANNGVFLRNAKPYQPADWFCMNCHPKEQYRKLNAHVMLDASGKIQPRKCLICHLQAPDPGTLLRTGQPQLRDEPTALCLGCHARHSDINPKGHLGTAITDEVTAHIRQRDVGVLHAYLKRNAATRPDEGSPAADFPRALDNSRKIICATCHNPHQQKTFPAESILSYGAMRLISEDKVTASLAKEEVCRDCHDLSKLSPRSRPATTRPTRAPTPAATPGATRRTEQ